jgi:hypothetical protein
MPSSCGRRRALAAGLGVALVYLMLAALSGRLSPLARRPLLDGYVPTQYNYVSPPPELAESNQPPAAGDFTLQLTERGSSPDVLASDDRQFTLIPVKGTFPPAAGERQVHITVTPTDPATLRPPDPPLTVVGNAYRIEAAYEPSGRPVRTVAKPLETILVYPLTPNVHAATHTVIASANGTGWTASKGTDSTGNQQVEGQITTLGYVAAAGDLQPGSAPAADSGGRSTLGIALIVGAVCAALVGIGLLLRGR